MSDIPPFYDNLELSLAEARKLLADGAANRKSNAHHPVVATLGPDDLPRQRVMILRALDWEARLLRFHTDYRSTKVDELAKNDAASALIYDPASKIQLRLSGKARIEQDGSLPDAAWEQATLFARRCYLAEQAPGMPTDQPMSGLPEWVEGRQPTEDEVIDARANFAILLFEFDDVEWLYLANQGHRRARWRWDSATGIWDGSWLVP